MSAWPSSTITTTNLDAGTDGPNLARADLKAMADSINAMIAAFQTALGVAGLDASGQVPTTQLPTIPVSKGGVNQTSYSIGDILYASASGVLSKLSAGASGYVLKSNGAGAAPSWQIEGGGFASGTRTSFQQSSAPTGWTKETNSAYNNVAMRIVTGSVSSGGIDDFTTIFGTSISTDGHALTVAEMAPHAHTLRYSSGSTGANVHMQTKTDNVSTTGTINSLDTTTSVGSGNTHSHGLSMDIKYRDFIIAEKD